MEGMWQRKGEPRASSARRQLWMGSVRECEGGLGRASPAAWILSRARAQYAGPIEGP